MDIIKFTTDPLTPTKLITAEFVNGITSVMWIERYRDPGEFKIIAPESSDTRNLLPTGSLISHTDTQEVMIVENHELTENTDNVSEVTVTGRSFETVLENRLIGLNKTWPITTTLPLSEFSLTADKTWVQGINLINDHIYTPSLIYPNDGIDFVIATYNMTDPSVGTSVARSFPRGTVHKRLVELLALDDLGVRSLRPSMSSSAFNFYPSTTNTEIQIHDGVDKTGSVVFSDIAGEITNAQYLWSIKSLKNASLVVGKWMEVYAWGSATKYDKRIMMVDGSDLDNAYSSHPTGPTKDAIFLQMLDRGYQALANQKELSVLRADVSETSSNYAYRRDYNIGDWVVVQTRYGAPEPRRVTEYVEIYDENGERGYPTLSKV